MGTFTLLQLTDKVSKRLPLSATISTVVGNTEPLVAQLLEIMQECGDTLMRDHEWSRLYKTWTITLTADPHTEAFPSGYNRYVDSADFWRSGSDVTPMTGPVKSDDWHYIEDTPGTYPGYWRPYQTGVQITGVPTTETCDIEYIASTWIVDADGSTLKASWEADTDTTIFGDDLFMKGVRFMWKHSKGLDYVKDEDEYEKAKELEIARDRASRPLLTRRRIRDSYEARQFSWPGQVVET